MKILGLDQSSNYTGFAIFEDDKLIKYGLFDVHDIKKDTNGDLFYLEKIQNNLMFLDRIIKEYNIDFVAIEDIQKQTNILTYKKLAWLQGNLVQYLYNLGIKFTIISPSKWRSILGIKGRGRTVVKKNTIKYVEDKFNINIKKDDESDAIAIGYAVSKRIGKKSLEVYERKEY